MAKFALTRNGLPSRPGSVDTPRSSTSWFFSNSSISGEKVSHGRPRRCSSAAPVSWSAKASVRSSRLAMRSRRTCRSSRRLGASIAPVTIGRTYYISGLRFRPNTPAKVPAAWVPRIDTTLLEYAALDLETTGLDPARDRVIEVGAVAFTPDRTLATLERLVDPQRPLPEAVARLTGITQADLKGAATAESAVRELINFIGGRQPVGPGAPPALWVLALVAPYGWALARFFAESLTAPNPETPAPQAAGRRSTATGPGGMPPPDDPHEIAAMLAPEGALAGTLPGYEQREPQLQMVL